MMELHWTPEAIQDPETIYDYIEADNPAAALALNALRIDSTVVDSNIAPPLDSGLLEDGVRVLSRLMANSRSCTGVKIRFVDQRKRSKSLAFRIFHAKNPEKDRLYPDLIRCAEIALNQTAKAIEQVARQAMDGDKAKVWIDEVEHYRGLLLRIIHQTQRRVFYGESVPASEKLVSLFEPHTDIIAKSSRNIQYGHKVNLATEQHGFITYFNIENGNPADTTLYRLRLVLGIELQFDEMGSALPGVALR